MPLMEIVTEPDIRTAEQARRYAEELRLLMKTIGASDAEMENGQMRVEANVSIRPRGREAFGTRVEVKNMNSMKAVERAIAYEIERQAELIDGGGAVRMETRGWDDAGQSTYHMRPKEEENDYRYFPEPDLPPLVTTPRVAGRDQGPRCRSCPRPAGRATSEARPLGVRRRASSSTTPTATRCSRARSPPVAGLPAKLLANWVTGEYMRLAKGEAERRHRRSGAAGGPGQAGRRRRDLRHQRARKSSPSTSPRASRVASIVEKRGFRQISDAGRSARPIDAGARGQPGRRGRLSSRHDRRGRLPGRPGHEGDTRSGQRGHGPGRVARTAGQGRVARGGGHGPGQPGAAGGSAWS